MGPENHYGNALGGRVPEENFGHPLVVLLAAIKAFNAMGVGEGEPLSRWLPRLREATALAEDRVRAEVVEKIDVEGREVEVGERETRGTYFEGGGDNVQAGRGVSVL